MNIISRTLSITIILGLLVGCAPLGLTPQVVTTTPEAGLVSRAQQSFASTPREVAKQFATASQVSRLAGEATDDYHLGPGDVMEISVWNRPEISRNNVIVAPDGTISVPKVGILNVQGKTIAMLTEEINAHLSRSYEAPETAIILREFNNNKAFVLGRVSKPGVVNFPGNGTLLEALALAGGLPHIGKDTFLTKCAIVRGRDTVIWIDLRDLLDHGNMALNARILNNDVIFIPEAEDEMVMVLGEVAKPGPVLLKRGLNLTDALVMAGGYTAAADLSQVFIIRQGSGQGEITQVDLRAMLERGDFSHNYALSQDDFVYVGPTGMRKFNYALEQLMPSLSVLSMSTSILDNLGLTSRGLKVQN